MTSTEQAEEKYAQLWMDGTYDGPPQGSTPLLESLITHLHLYRQLTSMVPLVLEGGAGSGDHAIRLVQEGFFVIANEYNKVAVARIRQRGNTQLSRCLQTKLQVPRPKDIVKYLEEKGLQSFDGFYANSVLHTFLSEKIQALYRALYKVQPQGGLIAVSFKAEGDSLQYKGEFREKTEAGQIVRDQFGMDRLFVRNPEPLIEELSRAGYRHLKTFDWEVKEYIAVKAYDPGVRKFIGFLAQKE